MEFIIGNTDLPLFNQDIEADPPAAVKEFYKIVETADAIMIATPEHNFQMAASTKNFLVSAWERLLVLIFISLFRESGSFLHTLTYYYSRIGDLVTMLMALLQTSGTIRPVL